jgi:hypothetical protein
MYFEYLNKNLFIIAEKRLIANYPLYDMQIIKFIRIFVLALFGFFVLLKGLISKMSKKLFIIPFIFLFMVDLALGFGTFVQCMSYLFTPDLFDESIRKYMYDLLDSDFYNPAMYNLTIDMWKGMITNWSFLVVDIVAFVSILSSDNKAQSKSVPYVPGILATIVVCFYIGCNALKMTNNIFKMELVALIIFAVAYYLIGWLLIKQKQAPVEQTVAAEIVEQEEAIPVKTAEEKELDEIDRLFL